MIVTAAISPPWMAEVHWPSRTAGNGIGFEAGSGEKLFERGFTSKVNGSGIGLHECRSIIESHDGTITMKSEGINTGAATIITFPIFK